MNPRMHMLLDKIYFLELIYPRMHMLLDKIYFLELIYPCMHMLPDKIYFLELIYPHSHANATRQNLLFRINVSSHVQSCYLIKLLFGNDLSSNVHATRHNFYLERIYPHKYVT